MCVCFSHQQFVDLIRFCAEGDSVVHIDTTFKIGRYYLTVITYRNLSLVKNGSDQHPIFIGPILIHLKKNFASFLYFAMSLTFYQQTTDNKIKLDSSILNIKRIITDDDQALHGAFKKVFTSTQFLLCCNHLVKDIERNLGNFLDSEKHKCRIIESIFGTRADRKRCLIASTSREEFESLLETLYSEWSEIKKVSNCKKSFADYFRKRKEKKIFEHVVEPNFGFESTFAGGNYFTTNDVEAINSVIKALKHTKSKFSFCKIKIIKFFEDFSDAQVDQSVLSMKATGDYQLSNEFKKFFIKPSVWNNQSRTSLENQAKKFLSS